MNIRQLKYFVSVFRLGSFSAAAKDLFVTVQAVSKAISDLESELNKPLFIRENRGVRATTFGRCLYEQAMPVAEAFDELERYMDGSEKLEHDQATLSLGVCAPRCFHNGSARTRLVSFFEQRLGVPVRIHLRSTKEDAVSALRRGEIDAFFSVGLFDQSGCDFRVLGSLPIGFTMRAGHPLAECNAISPDDAYRYPVAFIDRFDFFQKNASQELRRAGIELPRETCPSEDVVGFLNERDGLIVGVGFPVLSDLYPGAIARPLKSGRSVMVPLCLVTAKSDKSPSLISLEKWFADELPRPNDLMRLCGQRRG